MKSSWTPGDPASRFLVDIAAGRQPDSGFSLTQEGLALANQHGLMGLMATNESSQLSELARPVFVRLSARQRVMVQHLHRILEQLDRVGIRATVLKGPQLATEIYRVPGHRTFTDIDLLVEPRDLERALEVIAADIAVPSIPPQGPRADKRNIPIRDPGGVRFTLDLHWDLFSYTQLKDSARGATDWAWSQARAPVGSELGPMWSLPESAMICFLCTHALLDHRFRLILFRDLTEVSLRSVDWDEVGRFAQRWRLRSTTYVALLIASHLTAAEVPTDFLASLRPRSSAIRITERLLRSTDLVRFDGHHSHPLNLAIVLLHDSALGRLRLAARAPVAFPNWQRRVGIGAPRERTSPPRVSAPSLAVLVTTDRRRGAEVFGERLTDALRKRGWEATLLALSHDTVGPRLNARTVSNRTPEQLGRLDLRVVLSLREVLSRLQTQIVLANGSATLQYALAASRTLRGPIRVVYTSIGEPLYWMPGSGRRLIQRALLSRADLVLAVSESTKRQLVDGVGLAEHMVAVAPTGVPESFFDISPSQPNHTDLRLLFLGNLSREKDPLTAVDLAHRLSQSTPVQLRFVGEGPLLGALYTKVEALGLAEAIAFGGSVDDVAPHLAWADLLILTSETEGLPGVVLEAAAAGVPAVAFDVGGVAETIQAGVTGELVPPGNIDALSSALAGLAGDRTRLIEMGQRAKAFAAERYSLERAVDRYHEILTEQLVGTRQGREPSRSAG